MIRFFRWLFTGDAHKHKWKQVEKWEIKWGGRTHTIVYICQCETCGKMKEFRVN